MYGWGLRCIRVRQRAIDDVVIERPLLPRVLDADLRNIEIRKQLVGERPVLTIEGDQAVKTGQPAPPGVRRFQFPVGLIVHPFIASLRRDGANGAVDVVLVEIDQQRAQRLDDRDNFPAIGGDQLHVGFEQQQRRQIAVEQLPVDSLDAVGGQRTVNEGAPLGDARAALPASSRRQRSGRMRIRPLRSVLRQWIASRSLPSGRRLRRPVGSQ